jgi:SAM-dependent methyltransferase
MEKSNKLSLSEYFRLLWLNLVVQKRNFCEFIRVAYRYYPNWAFFRTDFSLVLSYLLNSPFAISKRFLRERGEKEIYAYGETPLTSLEKIAKASEISSQDTVFELGCGRGRTCFWLDNFVNCRVVGIDYVPEFIDIANAVKTKFGRDRVEFRLQDMLKADLTGATVVYLYGTCLEDESIKKLIDKFKRLPAGTKIITISYPLSDYTQEPLFEVMKRFPVNFNWGETDLFLQIKRS